MNSLQEIVDSASILLSPPFLIVLGVIFGLSALLGGIKLVFLEVKGETPSEKRNALILGCVLILIALGMINGMIPQPRPNLLQSNDPEQLFIFAQGYESQGDFNLSKQAYEKALRNSSGNRSQNPQTQNAQIWYSYGLLLSKLGEHKSAIDAYKNAIAATVNQAFPEAWRQKGFSYQALGDYPTALDCYDKVITLPTTPNSLKSIAWNDKGWIYELSKNYQDAGNAYLQANILDQNNSYAFTNLNRLNQQGLANQPTRLPTSPLTIINVTAPPSSLQPILMPPPQRNGQ